MATEITSIDEYRQLRAIPLEDRDDEINALIYDYESKKVKRPTKEEVEWATSIFQERKPHLQKAYERDGIMAEALEIKKRLQAANDLSVEMGLDPNVRKVRTTPDDVMEAGGFKFNWRDAYKNVTGKNLRATEGDAKRLNDFINSSLYDIDARDEQNNPIKLRNKAVELKMWDPKTQEWSEFIHSEQGERFQNYLEDVQKAQKDKRLNEIWDGEDDNKVTSFLTDFMLPVSKEYGKKNYEKINVEDKVAMAKDMAGPLLTDIVANFVMTGLGSGGLKNRPLISWLYGNAAAPAVTETGNVLFNDQSIPKGLIRTAEGVAINIGTPLGVKAGTRLSGGTGDAKLYQRMINEQANKVRPIRKMMNDGVPYPVLNTPAGHEVIGAPRLYTKLGKKDIIPSITKKEGALLPEISRKRGKPTIYSTNPELSTKLSPPRKGQQPYKDYYDLPQNQQFIKDDEILTYKKGIPLLRGKNPAGGFTSKKGAPKREITTIESDRKWLKDDNNKKTLLAKVEASRGTHGDLSGLSPEELRRFQIYSNKKLPKYDKESFSNFLTETYKELAGDVPGTYVTNALGRPYFGRRLAPARLINQVLGDESELFKKDPTPEEAQLSRILKMLEKEHPYITK